MRESCLAQSPRQARPHVSRRRIPLRRRSATGLPRPRATFVGSSACQVTILLAAATVGGQQAAQLVALLVSIADAVGRGCLSCSWSCLSAQGDQFAVGDGQEPFCFQPRDSLRRQTLFEEKDNGGVVDLWNGQWSRWRLILIA